MPEKEAQNFAPAMYPYFVYLWVIVLSVWGGIANYVRKVREGETSRFSIVELIGEVVIAGFSGVVTFFLCEWANLPGVATAALVGIAGHMGSRGIFLAETWLKKKYGVSL